MREVRALGAAADAAGRGRKGVDLAQRAASARAARTAFMAARRGERERVAAAKAAPPPAVKPMTALDHVHAEEDRLHAANTVRKVASAAGMTASKPVEVGTDHVRVYLTRYDKGKKRDLGHVEVHGNGEIRYHSVRYDSAGVKATIERGMTGGPKAPAPVTPAPAAPKVNPHAAKGREGPVNQARPRVDRLKQTIFDPKGDQHVSIANAGGVHVVQVPGPRGKPSGEYRMINPATGQRLGVGYLSREKALALLEAGPTGRTLSRAKVGYGSNLVSPSTDRANRALARYERIQQSRAAATMAKGPAAPAPSLPSPRLSAPIPPQANPAKVRADFAEHREARVAGLEARAARLHGESDAAFARVRQIGDNIPLGQPILVGHHSEGRARADIRRIDAGMRKSVDLHREAEATAARAAAAAKSRAVSSDDPAAVGKLHEKLAHHQALQERMTATNKVIKAAERKGENPHAALLALGHSPEAAHKLVQPDFAGRRGFPDYATKNNSAEVRRLQTRIADLSAHRAAPSMPAEQHGRHTIEEGGNRVKVTFAGKPSEATRSYMKSNGFRWAPSEGVWQRNTSATAWQHARAAAAMEG
jgi:hypothetical protein